MAVQRAPAALRSTIRWGRAGTTQLSLHRQPALFSWQDQAPNRFDRDDNDVRAKARSGPLSDLKRSKRHVHGDPGDPGDVRDHLQYSDHGAGRREELTRNFELNGFVAVHNRSLFGGSCLRALRTWRTHLDDLAAEVGDCQSHVEFHQWVGAEWVGEDQLCG